MFGEIFNGISGIITGWLSFKREQQATKRAVETRKQQLALSTESNDSSWELAEIANSDKWLRRISFAMFSAPLIVIMFDAAGVTSYFYVLITAIPSWWLKIWIGINGSVWGISSLRNVISSIIWAFKK